MVCVLVPVYCINMRWLLLPHRWPPLQQRHWQRCSGQRGQRALQRRRRQRLRMRVR